MKSAPTTVEAYATMKTASTMATTPLRPGMSAHGKE
jgi:hypothetical protein